MSSSVFDQMRQAMEDLESLEKAAAKVMAEKDAAKTPKEAMSSGQCVARLVQEAVRKAKLVGHILEDKDNMRKEEWKTLAGGGPDKRGRDNDVWTNFYDQVKEVKDYHKKFRRISSSSIQRPNIVNVSEVHNADWFYRKAKVADDVDAMFSAEEEFGKRLDLHSIYQLFLNLRKFQQHLRTTSRNANLSRLKRKNPDFDEKSEETRAKINEFEEMDYVLWLKKFDSLFLEIPRACKYNDKDYATYLEEMLEYFTSIARRALPLENVDKFLAHGEEEFERRWAKKQIPGWEQETRLSPLFVLPTNKLLTNEAVLEPYKKGKYYKKKLEELQKNPDRSEELVKESLKEDMNLALMETQILRFKELLENNLQATINHCEKKQSRTVEEMLLEEDEDDGGVVIDDLDDLDAEEKDEIDVINDDEDDRPIYNPLNLPLGWDGKPIPFWLYKLHGLGQEFQCEICGNYSYWGRRQFEKHFSEWRHAHGMRCLKIPNTAHFREVTKIADAIQLYEKLKKDAANQTFDPDVDVECEDMQGNVMNQKTFDDLRRQGLV